MKPMTKEEFERICYPSRRNTPTASTHGYPFRKGMKYTSTQLLKIKAGRYDPETGYIY